MGEAEKRGGDVIKVYVPDGAIQSWQATGGQSFPTLMRALAREQHGCMGLLLRWFSLVPLSWLP